MVRVTNAVMMIIYWRRRLRYRRPPPPDPPFTIFSRPLSVLEVVCVTDAVMVIVCCRRSPLPAPKSHTGARYLTTAAGVKHLIRGVLVAIAECDV